MYQKVNKSFIHSDLLPTTHPHLALLPSSAAQGSQLVSESFQRSCPIHQPPHPPDLPQKRQPHCPELGEPSVAIHASQPKHHDLPSFLGTLQLPADLGIPEGWHQQWPPTGWHTAPSREQ